MNISLSKSKKKKKQYGLLNNPTVVAAGFGGDDDDEIDSDKEASSSGRAHINRDLAMEQAALRKRAAASLEQNSEIYDYDGAYDSFARASGTNNDTKENDNSKKKSRYVEDLLKAAKRRDKERDVILERKIAKEQQEEEDDDDFHNKDKFVTKAYRKKLAERELWAQEEAVREQQELKEDVTKKKGGMASSFYGNLNRNVAMGGGGDNITHETNVSNASSNRKDADEVLEDTEKSKNPGFFMEGFELTSGGGGNVDSKPTSQDDAAELPSKEQAVRNARQDKVARARMRYFQRNGISEESIADPAQ